MLNFSYHNPVNIVFGKGTIAELDGLLSSDDTVMLTYGGGSIKKNGVYGQVTNALKGRNVITFGGIEPNPAYETLMKAVELAREKNVTFLLSVGGGSVLDGTKFIAAAIPFEKGKEWDILSKKAEIESAVPLGCVLTLPATGSEMNINAVISRKSTSEKLVFKSPLVYPVFSILDPATTFSLPERQTVNGIVDTFVHVMEQYMTYHASAPLQDRQAEAILLTLIEESPKALASPEDYDIRANLMWCATHGLNGMIGCGVPQDWSTHMIGHEITALYGIDHARTLAIVLPAVMKHEAGTKRDKIIQYGERIFGITSGTPEDRIEKAITKTKVFFESLGVPTSLNAYDVEKEGLARIGKRIDERGTKLGEHGKIGGKEIDEILALCI